MQFDRISYLPVSVAYDIISNPSRLSAKMNIKNYGDGSANDIKDIKTQVNNYATITAINGKTVTYKNKTTEGLAPIAAGALVMIHFNHKSATYTVDSGRFILAKVVSDTSSQLTLDTAPPSISVTNYAAQVVSIPQANNFTLGTSSASVVNNATPKFDGAQGGIFAIAVKGTCDLSYGRIDVMDKGGGNAYGRAGLAYIGNAQDCDKLPIGQGHGSVFILAQNITMTTSTRIGHTSSGGGTYGYRGSDATTDAGFRYGSGAAGGTGVDYAGGYGGNGTCVNTTSDSARQQTYQGAHIMIVANQIAGFSLYPVCTGGYNQPAGKGGNGYNYIGSYNGGGSGSSQ